MLFNSPDKSNLLALFFIGLTARELRSQGGQKTVHQLQRRGSIRVRHRVNRADVRLLALDYRVEKSFPRGKSTGAPAILQSGRHRRQNSRGLIRYSRRAE